MLSLAQQEHIASTHQHTIYPVSIHKSNSGEGSHRFVLRKNHVRTRKIDGMTRFYRTDSYLGLTVISGSPPLDYGIWKRTIWTIDWKEFTIREPENSNWIAWSHKDMKKYIDHEIQRETSEGSFWTKELLSIVDRKAGPTDLYVTQAVTGHGMFNEYSHRFNRRNTLMSTCLEGNQSPEHTFRSCSWWAELQWRRDLAIFQKNSEGVEGRVEIGPRCARDRVWKVSRPEKHGISDEHLAIGNQSMVTRQEDAKLPIPAEWLE